jgi:Tfp pilus assembly protein FimT
MKKRENKKGFTFLELILIIGLIGVMAAITIASLSSGKNIIKLRAAQSEIASALKLAQSYALQGRVNGTKPPGYYGIKFYTSTSYGLCACLTADCSACTNANDLETYSLEGGVTTTMASNSHISFLVPHGTKNPSGTTTITLQISGASDKTVVIGDKGLVEEN